MGILVEQFLSVGPSCAIQDFQRPGPCYCQWFSAAGLSGTLGNRGGVVSQCLASSGWGWGCRVLLDAGTTLLWNMLLGGCPALPGGCGLACLFVCLDFFHLCLIISSSLMVRMNYAKEAASSLFGELT